MRRLFTRPIVYRDVKTASHDEAVIFARRKLAEERRGVSAGGAS